MSEQQTEPDLAAAAAALEAFLRALGQHPERNPELRGTGLRVAELFARELCAGESVDLCNLLKSQVILCDSEQSLPAQLWLRRARVSTTCPHHLLPAEGEVSIGFAPTRALVGLGALTQLVRVAGRRLVLQETLGEQIAEAIFSVLSPRWLVVKLTLRHGCMRLRGEGCAQAEVESLAVRGDVPEGVIQA